MFKEENLTIFTSNKDLQATLSDIITKVFQGLIFVSILGVLNSFCASSINIFREQVESYGIIGAKKLLKITKNDGKKAGLLLLFLFISFWSIPNCFLAFYWNTDFFIDGISNFPTLFFFLVYALVPLLTTIQKIRYQTRLTFKNLLYGFYSLIGFLTISAIILYQVIYIFCYQQGVIRYDVKNDLGWGGFLELDAPEITGFIVCIILLVMLSIFIFIPLINQGMVSFFTLKRAVSYYDIKKVRGELTEFQLLTNKDNFRYQSPKPLLNEKDQLLFSVLTVERKNFLKRKQHLLQLQKAWGKSVYDQLGKNF